MTELRKTFITDESTGRVAKLDDMTDVVMTIDYAHHEIHSGSHYEAEVHVIGGTAISLAFKTPPGTKRIHLLYDFVTESKVHVDVIEGAVWTTNTGTVVAPLNQRRDSANVSALLEDKTATPAYTAGGILQTPTIVAGGVTKFTEYAFAGKSVGNAGGRDNELILDVDNTYAFLMTSDDGSKDMQLRLHWYEHTDSA